MGIKSEEAGYIEAGPNPLECPKCGALVGDWGKHERSHIVVGAKEYVDIQLATMAKYGSAPNLTPEQYEALISKIVKIVQRTRR